MAAMKISWKMVTLMMTRRKYGYQCDSCEFENT